MLGGQLKVESATLQGELDSAMQFGMAATISCGVAVAAWRLKALSADGAIAAIMVGTAVLTSLGWAGLGVLGTFFVSSTVVSRLAMAARGGEGPEDRETRNARQVLANGGFAALGALAEFRTPGLGLWLATVGLAAAGGDTWATALGSLGPRPPRDLLTWRRVRPGQSGGVTWFGSSGGLMGAALIGLAAIAAGGPPRLFLTAALVGAGAMLLDSGIGSGLQARYRCDTCGEETEQRRHRCGTTTVQTRGIRWLDNDVVNALASGCAVATGWLLW